MLSPFTLLVLGAIGGLGVGFTIGALLAGLGVLWAKQRLDDYEARVVAKALGMVRDITQTRAATPPSAHPIKDAVEAEALLFAAKRRIELDQAQHNVILRSTAQTKPLTDKGQTK